jgi:hypothetical protein
LALKTRFLPTHWISPVAIIQSSIFSGKEMRGRKGRPVYVRDTQLTGYGSLGVLQTSGAQLDQAAADVWYELIKRSLQLPEQGGQVLVTFDESEFLRSIRRDTGGASKIWLRDTLSLLGGARFQLTLPATNKPGFSFEGSLVGDIMRRVPGEQATRKNAAKGAVIGVRLKVSLATLFGATRWSKLNPDIRLSLAGKVLAQWLHSFYSTHAEPFFIAVATIQKCSGCESIRPDKFLQKLQSALADLAEATGWKCGVSAEGGKVIVKKTHQGACPALLPAPVRVEVEVDVSATSPHTTPAAPIVLEVSRERIKVEQQLAKALQRMTRRQEDWYAELVDILRANFQGYRGANRDHYLLRLEELKLEAAMLAAGRPSSRRGRDLRKYVEDLVDMSYRTPPRSTKH